jgi:hypothetical protein
MEPLFPHAIERLAEPIHENYRTRKPYSNANSENELSKAYTILHLIKIVIYDGAEYI